VVFYGTEQPEWLPESSHLRIQDGNQRFYVFQRAPSGWSVEGRYLVSVGNTPSRCAQSYKCIETFLDFKIGALILQGRQNANA
jgi:hypothetical protein